MTTTTLFVDTNVFLHCRDLDQLPWREVFDADEIRLLVAAPVQEEIDRLKGDGSAKRAKRARKAASLLKTAIGLPELAVEIRAEAPRIVVAFAPPLRDSRCNVETLDLARADDRLIWAVVAFAHEQPDCDVRVFSHDVGPLACAQRHNVRYAMVPDSWRLEPEPDERDKRIRELTLRVQALEKNSPVLELAVRDTAHQPLSSIDMSVIEYEPLLHDEIESVANDIFRRFPLETDFQSKPPVDRGRVIAGRIASTFLEELGEWEAPSDQAIRDYQQAYATWREDIQKRVAGLQDTLNAGPRVVGVNLVLANTGVRSADRVLVEIVAHGGLVVRRGDREDERHARLSKVARSTDPKFTIEKPPTAPKGRFVLRPFGDLVGFRASSALSSLKDVEVGSALERSISPHLFAPPLRDRHTFYAKNGQLRVSSNYALECEEFRHGLGERLFPISIVIPPNIRPVESSLHCRVSASNVDRCVEQHLPIRISYQSQSMAAIARSWRMQANDTQKRSQAKKG